MKITLLTTFLTVLAFVAKTQDAGYFKIGMTWNQSSVCTGHSSNGCFIESMRNIRITDDTVINGKTCYILQETVRDSTYYFGPPEQRGDCHTYVSVYSGVSGYVRQADKKIYVSDGVFEQLAYDYDLNAGDTMPASLFTGQDNVVITGVDTVYVGQQPRIKFSYNSSNTPAGVLIEGLGSELGFLVPDYMQFECSHRLNCVALDAEGNSYPAGEPCFTSLSVNEETQKKPVNVYPTPADNFLAFSGIRGNHRVLLFNTLGELVLEKTVSQSDQRINVNTIPLGTYYLVMTSESGYAFQQKVMILR